MTDGDVIETRITFGQFRQVFCDWVVNTIDITFVDGDADQCGCEGFGYRE